MATKDVVFGNRTEKVFKAPVLWSVEDTERKIRSKFGLIGGSLQAGDVELLGELLIADAVAAEGRRGQLTFVDAIGGEEFAAPVPTSALHDEEGDNDDDSIEELENPQKKQRSNKLSGASALAKVTKAAGTKHVKSLISMLFFTQFVLH